MTATAIPPAFGAVEINQEARAAILDDHKALQDLGFKPSPPFFAIGSQVEATKEGFLRRQAEFEALPEALDGITALAAQVEKEERRDLAGKLENLRLGVRDEMTVAFPEGEEGFTFERDGFRDLAARLKVPGAGTYLPAVSPQLRAINWGLLPRSGDVLLRTRRAPKKDDDTRSIYAVVSSRYSAYNSDKLARDLAAILDEKGVGGARADIAYDGFRTEVRVLWHNYHDVRKSGAGDVFRFGVLVRTGDDGKNALKVALVAYLNRCLNYIIVAEDEAEVGSLRHLGRQEFREEVKGLVQAALSRTDGFLERWQEAGRENLLAQMNLSSPKEVFEALVKRGLVRVPGVKPADLVERCLTAYRRYPGYSRLAYINAITEAAHKNTWASRWTQTELEKQAGQLLYVRIAG